MATGQRIVQPWAQQVHLKVLPFPQSPEAAWAERLRVAFFARTCTTASEFLDP